jgi:hypothetical protein
MSRAIARSRLSGWTTAACILSGGVVLHAQLMPRGGEFQVSQRTLVEAYPAVAATDDGGFLVVWVSEKIDFFSGDLVARKLDALGQPTGDQFDIEASGYVFRGQPSIAAVAGKGMVVAWHAFDDSGVGIRARKLDSSGNFDGPPFQVNTYTTHHQSRPMVAMELDGDFMVVWQSYGQSGPGYNVFGRRFASSGSAAPAELQINIYTYGGGDLGATVASLPSGGFVVVWRGNTSAIYSHYAILARRLDDQGTPQATEFQVTVATAESPFAPAVIATSGGEFVVVWHSIPPGGTYSAVSGRRFDSSGAPVGVRFAVSTDTQTHQARAALATDASSGFVVAWARNVYGYGTSDDSLGVRAFDSTGSPQAAEFQVNVATDAYDRPPGVAGDGAGHFLVVWHRNRWDPVEFDGFDYRVLARRFASSLSILDLDGNGAVDALTDGILILRHRLGFTDSTLVGGAVAAACTRCDAPAIEAYIDSILDQLDVDGDGTVDALTDALLILRFAFGFRGEVLVDGATGPDCARCDADSIETFLIPLFV